VWGRKDSGRFRAEAPAEGESVSRLFLLAAGLLTAGLKEAAAPG